MRGDLRQTLFWGVTLIAVLPLIALSLMGFWTAESELRRSVRQNLVGLARLQVLQLNDYFESKRRRVRLIASQLPAKAFSKRNALEMKLQLLRREHGLVAIGIQREGSMLWVGQKHHSHKKRQITSLRKGLSIVGVFHHNNASETVVRLAKSVVRAGVRMSLVVDFPFSIHQRFLQEKRAPAFLGSIFLLDRRSRVMCGSFDVSHSHHMFGSQWTLPAALRGGGRRGVRAYTNHKGLPVFGIAVPMREVPWTLLIEIPSRKALASLYSLRNRGLLLLGISLLLLLGAVAWSSERVSREQKLLTAQLIQREKMAAVGLLASGVAHEIGNPLASASMLVQRLQSSVPADDEANVTRLRELDERCQAIARILETMSDYTRQKSAQWVPLDVGREMQRAVELVRFDRRLHKIQIEWEIASELPLVWGQEDALQQVFTNLLLNAIDALESVEDAQIWLRAWPTGDGLRCRVCDNGPGIARGMQSQIFEPFVTSKGDGKGTGLGLSVSRQILIDMGGSLEAKRVDGRTCFELSLSGLQQEVPNGRA